MDLFETTFTHKISKYASRIKLETLFFSSSLLYKISLRNFVVEVAFIKTSMYSLVNDENY